jgi:hypothetical protein
VQAGSVLTHSTEGLRALLKAETSEQVFAAVPLHYVGVSTLLLEA